MPDFWSKQICFAVFTPVYSNVKIKVLGASDVKLFDFKVTLKWMEVNGMLKATGPFPVGPFLHGGFNFRIWSLPLGVNQAIWASFETEGSCLDDSFPK